MLNTENLLKCIDTLESSLARLQTASPNTVDYEVFRHATIKGFELSLELCGKLLRKALKIYAGDPRTIDSLAYKDLFRQAAKHGILDITSVNRWFSYRDNRNDTAHDYGVNFTQTTLKLLPAFLHDAKTLQKMIQEKLGGENVKS